MRRIITSTLVAGAVLMGGAAGEAQAAPVAASAQHATTVSERATPVHSGAVSVASDRQPTAKDASVERRRPRQRTQRRGFFSRLFGTLMFLFIGLPLLIVLGIALMVMMRRNRRGQESRMRDERRSGNGGMNERQDVYRGGSSGRH